MTMKYFTSCLLMILLLVNCQNLEDAEETDRKSFVYFYNGANSRSGIQAEVVEDGFVVLGNITVTGDNARSSIVVIKTNAFGQPEWETTIEGASASALKVIDGGYLIVGDSIQFNLQSTEIANLINTSSRIIRLDMDGNIVSDRSFSIKIRNPNDTISTHVDFHSDAVTTDGLGNVICLGTYRFPGDNEFAYVVAMNPNGDTLWTKDYDYIQRDYLNTPSVFYREGQVLWGASISAVQANFSRSYLTIPVIKDSSVFVNSDYFGESLNQSIIINDLQPSALGYAATGTFSDPNGLKGNVFFIRIDRNGNFKDETLKYYDGVRTAENETISDPTISDTEDTGNAITATRDGGYVIAATLVTTPSRGNGGTDLWLIKVDASGNPLWNKIIGGPTNEQPSSIKELADGSLVICGTIRDGEESTGGVSSIFLFKTDRNGELTN